MEDKGYCVYLHRRSDTNEIIYVGEGRLARARNLGKSSCRNKQYGEIQKETKIVCEIYKDGLLKEEAESLEQELILKLKAEGVPLTNKAKGLVRAKACFKEDFDNKFYIDASSPSGLRWKTDRFNKDGRGHKLASKDDAAGGKNKLTGYWEYGNMRCHRIVYAIAHGECPEGLTIDHIDGNKDNNSVENLQLLSRSDNSKKSHIGRTYADGEDVSTAKITEKQALEMYSMFEDGKTNEQVAEVTGLHSRYVSLVRHGRRWKKLYQQHGKKFDVSFTESVITLEVLKEVLTLLHYGLTNKDVSDATGVEASQISRIRSRQTLKTLIPRALAELEMY